MTRSSLRSVFAVALVLGLQGCEDETVTEPEGGGVPVDPQEPAATAAAEGGGAREEPGKKKTAAPAASVAPLPVVEYTETDFVESEESRDPFRSYEGLFVERTSQERRVQRKVKAPQYALDQLRLTGIVTRGTNRALFTDPNGFGWVLYTGDYVGQPELVSVGTGEGQEIEINWRIDRIRGKDVVFIREDPSHPEVPPTTRVMPLYAAGEEATTAEPG